MGLGQSTSDEARERERQQRELANQQQRDAETRNEQQRLRQQREQQQVQRENQQRSQELELQRRRERDQQMARQQELANQQAVYDSLSLREAVERAMRTALEKGVDEVGFEREFKRQLQIFARNATVQRKGGAQFQISAPGQSDVFASLRLDAAPNVLQQFRSVAPAVRRTLLGDSAYWLRQLGRDGQSIDGFLAACNVARETPTEAREGDHGAESCNHCGKSLRTDCLPGGGHHCKMMVKFRCPQCGKSWTTQRGRYSVREQRVLDHDCAGCHTRGEVVEMEVLTTEAVEALRREREERQAAKQEREERRAEELRKNQRNQRNYAWWQEPGWGQQNNWHSSWNGQTWQQGGGDDYQSSSWQDQSSNRGDDGEFDAEESAPQRQQPVALLGEVSMLDSQPQTIVPHITTEQHRSDLCEGCKRYGDCSGLFIEPFQVFAIAKLLSMDTDDDPDEDSLHWREADGAVELVGFRMGPVRLLPHIYEESARIPSEEAAQITSRLRNTGVRQNDPASQTSSSQTSSMNSSADRAMRRHFQNR